MQVKLEKDMTHWWGKLSLPAGLHSAEKYAPVAAEKPTRTNQRGANLQVKLQTGNNKANHSGRRHAKCNWFSCALP